VGKVETRDIIVLFRIIYLQFSIITIEKGKELNCQTCEQKVDLPFKCSFCGGYFCTDHRLPENHDCPELWRVRQREKNSNEKYFPIAKSHLDKIPRPRKPFLSSGRTNWSSMTEILHLTIGASIVMVVGLSLYSISFGWIYQLLEEPIILLGSAFFFTFIFISHELAHKTVAKSYGLWAEFRLNLIGAVLTLLSAALTPIKIVSPGAVLIVGVDDRKILGKIAFAGPFTSIVISSFLYIFYFLIPTGSLSLIVFRAAQLSSWIALLNLIPLGILDGFKIIRWNKVIWAIIFMLSIIMTIFI
jgi:Zn-dependent protease